MQGSDQDAGGARATGGGGGAGALLEGCSPTPAVWEKAGAPTPSLRFLRALACTFFF